jgi:hypothetical protein
MPAWPGSRPPSCPSSTERKRGAPLNDDSLPDDSGPPPPRPGRTVWDELTDRERELRSAEAIHHVTRELAELPALRTRVALATTILSRDADVQRALAVLRGEVPW